MTYTISICKAASLMAFVAQLAVSRVQLCQEGRGVLSPAMALAAQLAASREVGHTVKGLSLIHI